MKDYNINVLYHPGTANVVEDALSRMTIGTVSHEEYAKEVLVKDFHRLAILGC